MRHIKYSKTGSYGSVIRNLIDRFRYVGKDDGNPVFDYNKTLPIVHFTGTVKIHGTNSSVCFDVNERRYWVQSRKKVITPLNDNNGFAAFVEKNKYVFSDVINDIIQKYNIKTGIVTIYGEWFGKGIQSNIGVNQLEKTFAIFAVKWTKSEEDVEWLDFYTEKYHDDRIYHINYFGTYEIDIDMNNPELAQNILSDITKEVEKECPVAKKLGATPENGVMTGEGVVWSTRLEDGTVVRFKVKGEKHSGTKVKKLAKVDIEKLNSVNEFVEYAVTENRLNQGIEEVFISENKVPDIKMTGDFIRWVVNDVIEEEIDVLNENNLVAKDVNKAISVKARKWFFDNHINKI